MCKCISEIEKKALELKYKEQPIQKAKFISGAFVMSGVFKLKACGEMELTVEGRKKPVIQQVVYSYCPFCGVKY